jgi:hypothetical protein
LHKKLHREDAKREQTGGAQNKNGLKRPCFLIEHILKYLFQQPGNKCIFPSQYDGSDTNGSGTSGTHRRQDDGAILRCSKETSKERLKATEVPDPGFTGL